MVKPKLEDKEKSIKIKLPEFYQAVGRRKTATARVRLYPVKRAKITVGKYTLDKGEMIVNDRPIQEYFPGKVMEQFYLEPFVITKTTDRFASTMKVEGSGLNGQLGAIRHAISRVLCQVDKDAYRSILKKHGLITRDPRMRERRKAGLAGKARAKKQSPKR